MKKITTYLSVLCFLCCMACSEDKEIGEVTPLTMAYELPQGKSTADERIVELYNRYGMFIVYDYENKDFHYDNALDSYAYELPDPEYVQDMMDLLEDIWFGFYSEKFHQKTLPYQIFLAKELTNTVYDQGKFMALGNFSLAFDRCSDEIRNITPEAKLKLKNELQLTLWLNKWTATGGDIEIPEEFYEVSDYDIITTNTDESATNYFKAEGFIDYIDGMTFKNEDIDAFIKGMLTWTSERWAEELKWPLVKKKYDILRDYFIENYNVDLKKIGDAVYE